MAKKMRILLASAKKFARSLSRTEFLSVNLQNSSSLTQACISLILHPVASRRKAVFFRELVSEVDVDDSRNDRTLLSFHAGLGDGSCGLLIRIALSMQCTMLHVRSMLK